MQIEDRIKPGGVGIGHQARQLRIVRISAAHQNMDHVVRLRFDCAVRLPAVRESRVDSTESRVASARHPGEIGSAKASRFTWSSSIETFPSLFGP